MKVRSKLKIKLRKEIRCPQCWNLQKKNIKKTQLLIHRKLQQCKSLSHKLKQQMQKLEKRIGKSEETQDCLWTDVLVDNHLNVIINNRQSSSVVVLMISGVRPITIADYLLTRVQNLIKLERSLILSRKTERVRMTQKLKDKKITEILYSLWEVQKRSIGCQQVETSLVLLIKSLN